MMKHLKRPGSRKGRKEAAVIDVHQDRAKLPSSPEEGQGVLEAPLRPEVHSSRPSSAASAAKPLPGLPSSSLRQLTLPSSASFHSSPLPLPPAAPYSQPASNASENWTAPEDAEGAYIRKTYAHFDASGIKGDGLVEGKEWTRERGSRAAWDASESAPRDRKPSFRMDHAANGGNKEVPANTLEGVGAKFERNHASSPLANADMPLTPASLEVLDSPQDVQRSLSPTGGQASAVMSGGEGFRASSSSLGSLSVESVHGADNGDGQRVAATDSDTVLEMERREMMKHIDRYGFFNRDEQTGHSSRSRITVLPSSSLQSIPKRRTGRNALRGHKEARVAPSSDMGPSTSNSTDEPSRSVKEGKVHSSQSLSLQNVIQGRESKEMALREREAMRVAKWDRMLEVHRIEPGAACYGLLGGLIKSKKLRKRVYKGIPDRWRAAVWWALLREQSDRELSFGIAEHEYRRLLDQPSLHDVQIDLDVPRTISGHVLFHTRYGQGQRSLFHVLHAFSLLCPKCAYCQGMGPIAATLLVYFPPEKAYAVMVELHNRSLFGLHDTFSPGFPGLVENFYVQKKLCEKMCPEVIASLEADGIVISSYATKWYITLYTNVLPFSTQLRLWDCFLLQGKDFLVVVAIAILWSLREQLISGGFETAMKLLTREFIPVDDDTFLNWIFLVMEREDTQKRIKVARDEYRQLIEQGREPVL